MEGAHLAVHPISGETVSPGALALAARWSAERPGAAVAVLVYTVDPNTGERFLSLKCYNSNFTQLCATGPINSPDVSKVFVTNPVFSDEKTMKTFVAAVSRCYTIIHGLFLRELSRATLFNIHVSKAGRVWRVFKEFASVSVTSTECEYVISQQPLPDDYEFPADLAAPYSFGPILHTNQYAHGPTVTAQSYPGRMMVRYDRLSSKHAPIFLDESPSPPPASHPHKERRRKHEEDSQLRAPVQLYWKSEVIPARDGKQAKERKQFACTMCGTKETTQTRCAATPMHNAL